VQPEQMNFNELIDKFQGASIGVLGSGPTLSEYQEKINSECDVVIACNGSLLALDPDMHLIDYFVCGDLLAPKRSWFHSSSKFQNKDNANCIRLVPAFLLPFDELALPDINQRNFIKKSFNKFVNNANDCSDYIYFNVDIGNIKLSDCIIFNYAEMLPRNINEIASKNNLVFRGATISGVAAQMAYKMGANKIVLFGCGFDNSDSGKNYAYDASNEKGYISEIQLINMDFILYHLIRAGVQVTCYGKTRLNAPQIHIC
jgi:hypothetical protein